MASALHRKGLLIVGGHAGVEAGAEHFRLFPWLAKNVVGFRLRKSLFGGHFGSVTQAWPQSILFGQDGSSYYAASGRANRASVSR